MSGDQKQRLLVLWRMSAQGAQKFRRWPAIAMLRHVAGVVPVQPFELFVAGGGNDFDLVFLALIQLVAPLSLEVRPQGRQIER